MADFHQTGVVTTLHRLGRADPDRLERELLSYSEVRPIALVLPCLHSEVRDVALKGIVETLKRVPYLRQVVVSVSGTSCQDEFEELRGAFDGVRSLHGEPP